MNCVSQPSGVHRTVSTLKRVSETRELIGELLWLFALSETALDREMVHALTWLPIKMFTTSVMEGAVDCWCWAITGRPELELLVNDFVASVRSSDERHSLYWLFQIVEEIYKAWEKTISDRRGLYSIDKPEPSPLAPSEKQELKPKPPSVNPHRIFLKVNQKHYRTDRWTLSESSSWKNVLTSACTKRTSKWKWSLISCTSLFRWSWKIRKR